MEIFLVLGSLRVALDEAVALDGRRGCDKARKNSAVLIFYLSFADASI